MRSQLLWWIFLSLILILGLWLAPLIYNFYSFQDEKTSQSINALFSGLAFAALVGAILLQRQELELQREELRGQRKQMEAQNETLRKQNFENIFFQLLRFHLDITQSIEIKYQSGTYIGRDTFRHFCRDWMARSYKRAGKESIPEADKIRALLGTGVTGVMYRRHFDLYFQSLCSILKLVRGSQLQNQYFYSDLVRALLSRYELALLVYHCWKNDEFRELAKQFSLFRDLDKSVLLNRQHYDALDLTP
jgi:hypothetical protein